MKKKGSFSTVLLILLLIMGLSLLLYPTVSEAWNSRYHERSINNYTQAVSTLDSATYQKMWTAAERFTASRRESGSYFLLTDEEKAAYHSLLNLSGNGVMGYLEIPLIGSKLAVYHGTEESVLQIGVGHLEWSSLPVGGESTHCIVSGHRGLPSARLFTDLDQLREGDVFILHILNEVLTYEVDQILIVEPDETDALMIEEGKDLCTLVTCTPYGINSHRLLVRGHRIANLEEAAQIRVTADAVRIEPLVVAMVLFLPILLLILSLTSILEKKTKKRKF